MSKGKGKPCPECGSYSRVEHVYLDDRSVVIRTRACKNTFCGHKWQTEEKNS